MNARRNEHENFNTEKECIWTNQKLPKQDSYHSHISICTWTILKFGMFLLSSVHLVLGIFKSMVQNHSWNASLKISLKRALGNLLTVLSLFVLNVFLKACIKFGFYIQASLDGRLMNTVHKDAAKMANWLLTHGKSHTSQLTIFAASSLTLFIVFSIKD